MQDAILSTCCTSFSSLLGSVVGLDYVAHDDILPFTPDSDATFAHHEQYSHFFHSSITHGEERLAAVRAVPAMQGVVTRLQRSTIFSAINHNVNIKTLPLLASRPAPLGSPLSYTLHYKVSLK